MGEPWMKFYTSDWRSDPRLRMCSMASRGLWIEMICLMHEAIPYGHLLVSGHCPTDAQLSVLAGAPSDQITALLGELESAGVFSRTREGVIYSRKMSRMAKKAATARNNGKKGGNPTLCNETENRPLVKGIDKADVKPQMPDARIQKEYPHTPKGVGFADFWSSWPSKVSKAAAEKAWKKLSPQDREAATSAASGWFDAWRRKHPDANAIHPASYLNGRRWEDETTSKPKDQPLENRLEAAASNILSGKDFLCRNIPASLANELVSLGMVTIEQCRRVQVL